MKKFIILSLVFSVMTAFAETTPQRTPDTSNEANTPTYVLDPSKTQGGPIAYGTDNCLPCKVNEIKKTLLTDPPKSIPSNYVEKSSQNPDPVKTDK